MAYMAHPNGSGQIEVEIVDEESHHGDYAQVRAVDDNIELRDHSGNLPWVDADDLFKSNTTESTATEVTA